MFGVKVWIEVIYMHGAAIYIDRTSDDRLAPSRLCDWGAVASNWKGWRFLEEVKTCN